MENKKGYRSLKKSETVEYEKKCSDESEGRGWIITESPYSNMGKTGEYYMVPNWLHPLLTEMGLTPQDRLVYECLLRFAHNSSRDPHPGHNTIMKFTGIGTKKTVIKSLNKLIDLGLVLKLKKGGRHTKDHLSTNVYRVKYVYNKEYMEKMLEKKRAVAVA